MSDAKANKKRPDNELVLPNVVSTHSITIKGPKLLSGVVDALTANDVSGCVVIQHNDTDKQHLHIYFVHEPIDVSTHTHSDKLKVKYKSIFGLGELSGNELRTAWAWCYPGTSLDSYWNYTAHDKKQKAYGRSGAQLLLWKLPDAKREILLPPPAKDVVIMKEPKKSSLEKQKKFLKYCKEFYDETKTQPTVSSCTELLFEYCRRDGFTTESCCFVWVNYALANLLHGPAYDIYKGEFSGRMMRKFFS